MRENIKKDIHEGDQDLWKLFLKTISEGIAIFDKDMRLVLLNDAVTKILGITKDNIGKTMLEISPTLKNTDRYKKYLEVVRTGKPLFIEDVVPEPKFDKIHLSMNCLKVGDGLGLVVTNITEEKRKEEQMKRLNLVLNAIRNVYRLITKEKDRRKLIKGACQALTETKGYYNVWIALIDDSKDLVMAEESGLGEKFLPLIKKLKSDVFIFCVQKALNQSGVQIIENPFSCSGCPLSKNYKNRGGVVARLEHEGKVFGIICASTTLKILSMKEELELFAVVANDISFALNIIDLEKEREKAEEELTRSRNEILTTLNSIGDAVISTDSKGNVVFMNPIAEDLTGWKENESIGKDIKEIFHIVNEETGDKVESPIARVIREGTVVGLVNHTILIAKDGFRIPIDDSGAPIKDVDGNIIGVVLVFRDITERKKTEEKLRNYSEQLEEMVEKRTEELREANEQLVRKEKLAVLGQLSGAIGHELRNPLGAIKNAAYFLNMVLEDVEPEVKDCLEILEKEVNRSDRIITNILSFARPKPIVSRKTNLNDVIKEALTNVVIPDNIKLISKLEESLPIIRADPNLLAQVFRNVILNGIQAMHDGGKLTIDSSSAEQDWVAISITDTGPGIPDDVLKKLFEPLFTTKAKGIGLGLTITKDIVERHGGSVDIQSKVGKGTTFTIKLPVRSKV